MRRKHIGLNRLHVPQWVWEGLPDYVGIENRETFEQLRDALSDRPVDIPMRVNHGSYPRYRLLVTYCIEKKSWSFDQLLQTKLTEDEATEIMRADENRSELRRQKTGPTLPTLAVRQIGSYLGYTARAANASSEGGS